MITEGCELMSRLSSIIFVILMYIGMVISESVNTSNLFKLLEINGKIINCNRTRVTEKSAS